MIWRLKGEIVFTNKNRRDLFIKDLTDYKVGKSFILDYSQSIDIGNKLIYRLDICFTLNTDTYVLYNQIKTKNKVGIISAFVNIHKCGVDGDINKPSHAQGEYYTY